MWQTRLAVLKFRKRRAGCHGQPTLSGLAARRCTHKHVMGVFYTGSSAELFGRQVLLMTVKLEGDADHSQVWIFGFGSLIYRAGKTLQNFSNMFQHLLRIISTFGRRHDVA